MRAIAKQAVTALTTIVTEDRRLEAAAEKTTGALAKHRWHWTKDESNPKRMTVTAYADLVGRDRSSINESLRLHKGVGAPPHPKGDRATKTPAEADDLGASLDELRPLAHELIDAGFKALAVKYHSDKTGGSDDAMAKLNDIRAILKRAFTNGK